MLTRTGVCFFRRGEMLPMMLRRSGLLDRVARPSPVRAATSSKVVVSGENALPRGSLGACCRRCWGVIRSVSD